MIVRCADCAAGRVLGEGPVPAEVMVVGEAPGAQEMAQGRPFIGDSGRYLNVLLARAKLDRAACYITNLVKHRPPKNRKPLKAEIVACSPALEMELDLVQPHVVLAIGESASTYFLGRKATMALEHGKARLVNRRVIVPMYHPAAAMRNPSLWPVIGADFARLPDELAQQGRMLPTDYRLVDDAELMAILERGYY